MNPFNTIESSCLLARENGLFIMKSALFYWEGKNNDKLLGCDGTGAVLWMNNLQKSHNRIEELCRLLEVDTWWLHRFWIGWSQNTTLSIVEDRGNNVIVVVGQDEVSKKASQLSKKVFQLK